MIYFLDFDRTLFDTDTFKVYLADRQKDPSITGEPEVDVARTLNALSASGALTFAPQELARFIYPDASELLQRLGDDAIIITFGNEALQKSKVESALAGSMPTNVLYTGDVLKGEYLKSWSGYAGQEAIYADDRVHELEIMAMAFPAMRSYEVRRDGGSGDGRWPVIRSLDELP